MQLVVRVSRPGAGNSVLYDSTNYWWLNPHHLMVTPFPEKRIIDWGEALEKYRGTVRHVIGADPDDQGDNDAKILLDMATVPLSGLSAGLSVRRQLALRRPS